MAPEYVLAEANGEILVPARDRVERGDLLFTLGDDHFGHERIIALFGRLRCLPSPK
jgi:hypothetical protein